MFKFLDKSIDFQIHQEEIFSNPLINIGKIFKLNSTELITNILCSLNLFKVI